MTDVTDEAEGQPSRHERTTRWGSLAAVTAVVVSVVPLATLGRLSVAVLFATAVIALVDRHGEPDHRVGTLATALLFVIVSWLHIGLTSPSVAWAVDSHMVPWLPLPGDTVRIAIAWSCTLAWTVLVTVAMSQIGVLRGRLVAIVALTLTAVLPLFNPEAFPVDGYELLWNRSTFTHPTYTLAVLALLAATAVLHPQPSKGSAGSAHPAHENAPRR